MLFTLMAVFAMGVFSCSPDPKLLQEARDEGLKVGYDSAMNYLKDSLKQLEIASENYLKLQAKVFDPSQIKHNPPYNGHVHDDGYQLLAAGGEYASGVMARVIDSAHNEVVTRLPFIIKKGKLKAGDDYLRDKKRHPHIDDKDVEIVHIPIINPTNGMPTGQYTLLAIVKDIVPKTVPHIK